jgi:hypothetical protein
MGKISFMVLMLLLGSCSAVLPNKNVETRQWQTADCSGAAGWETCFRKADYRCPNGYDFANKEENPISGLRKFQFSCRK